MPDAAVLETARRALAHWREYRGNPDHTVTLPAGVLHDLVVSTEALVELLAGGETCGDTTRLEAKYGPAVHGPDHIHGDAWYDADPEDADA